MEQKVVLEMRGINKNFPGVKALQDVDFTLRKGEIHALMGENGAGKSTLIKVLTGVEEFETGTIRMEGSSNTIINRSPQEAQENGISTVYQEVNLCPNLSVAENLYIGREPKKGPMIDWRTMKEDARKLLEGLDIHIDVTMASAQYQGYGGKAEGRNHFRNGRGIPGPGNQCAHAPGSLRGPVSVPYGRKPVLSGADSPGRRQAAGAGRDGHGGGQYGPAEFL